MTLNVPEMRRIAESIGYNRDDVLALIALAEQLKAAGARLVGAVEACAVAERGGPPVNWSAVDESQDAMRAALVAAREAQL